MNTFTERHINRNPIKNNTQSIIIDILFPYFPTNGPTKKIGKYCPIMLKDAVIVKQGLIIVLIFLCKYQYNILINCFFIIFDFIPIHEASSESIIK